MFLFTSSRKLFFYLVTLIASVAYCDVNLSTDHENKQIWEGGGLKSTSYSNMETDPTALTIA